MSEPRHSEFIKHGGICATFDVGKLVFIPMPAGANGLDENKCVLEIHKRSDEFSDESKLYEQEHEISDLVDDLTEKPVEEVFPVLTDYSSELIELNKYKKELIDFFEHGAHFYPTR